MAQTGAFTSLHEKSRLNEGDYLAQPKDSTLLSLLCEAFAVLERRFNIWDRDEAGTETRFP